MNSVNASVTAEVVIEAERHDQFAENLVSVCHSVNQIVNFGVKESSNQEDAAVARRFETAMKDLEDMDRATLSQVAKQICQIRAQEGIGFRTSLRALARQSDGDPEQTENKIADLATAVTYGEDTLTCQSKLLACNNALAIIQALRSLKAG